MLDTASSSKKTLKQASSETSDPVPEGDEPRRIFRKIKRNPLADMENKFEASNHSDSDDSVHDKGDSSDYDNENLSKKINKMKKRLTKRERDPMLVSDEDSELAEKQKKKAKKAKREPAGDKPARKKKAPPKVKVANEVDFGNDLNYVKTNNKLIGEIENNDLYASDEVQNDGFGYNATRDMDDDFREYKDQALDFASSAVKKVTKETDQGLKGSFLQKMKTKREH